ncbi:MAG: metal-dependent hydrolase [Solirubrobacteraceae bacterium]
MGYGPTSSWRSDSWRRRLLALSPVTLALGTLVLVAADWSYQLAGDSFFPGGPLDEIAHLMTTLLVFWALGPRACKRFLVPALIASVAIDLDHVPGDLGATFLTAGTPRPYTHSLLTIVVVLAIAWRWRRRRDVLLGVAIGLALHFFRDLAEGGSGVSLLLPAFDHSFQYPHSVYLAITAVVVLLAAARCARGAESTDRRNRARGQALASEQL